MTACCVAEGSGRFRISDLDSIVSWVFGVVLLISGIPHWSNAYYFLGSVFGYELVGPGLGQIIAMILPPLQLLLAVCLITRIWLDATHLIVMVMFGCFVTVQGLAYFRGLEIPCGCFGPCQQMPIGVTSLLAVSGFFLLSLVRNGLCWRSWAHGRR